MCNHQMNTRISHVSIIQQMNLVHFNMNVYHVYQFAIPEKVIPDNAAFVELK